MFEIRKQAMRILKVKQYMESAQKMVDTGIQITKRGGQYDSNPESKDEVCLNMISQLSHGPDTVGPYSRFWILFSLYVSIIMT